MGPSTASISICASLVTRQTANLRIPACVVESGNARQWERYSDIPYCDSKWSWNRESRHNCRYSPYASSSHQSPVETSQTAVRPSTNPTASSSSTGISHSDLLERVQSLEKQYKKLHDAFREQAVIIRRFEKTLIANNLSLGPIEQISDSDID